MKRILCLIPLTVSAQDILPDLVVTASRSAEEIIDTPYTTDIITSDDLRDNATRSLPDAFLQVPGVLVQKTTTAHGSPYIRGFTGRQNLLLQDGIRLNNSTWRSGPVQYWNTLDSQAIERIELIKNQGSVLYGSDAIGGTVNTLSKSSNFRDQDSFFTNGAAYYQFDTNSESHIGRIEQSFGVGNQWGILLGASIKDIGDIRDSALGRMRGTGYSETSFDVKFQYAFTQSRTLTLSHSAVDQDDISRWHNTINNPGWVHGRSFTTAGTDLARDYDQERALSYLRLEDNDAQLSWIDQWQVTASYQKTQDSEFRVRGSGRSDDRILDVETFGLSFQATSGHLTWGADYYHDEVASKGFRNGLARPSNRPVADDSSYDSLGIFANYQSDFSGPFNFHLGGRFTYAEAEWDGFRPDGATEDQSGEGSWEDFSFSLRGLYDLNDTWSLFGGVSQAFRAPNLDDLTGRQFALNGLDSNGSPDVDPEEFVSAEFGIRHESDSFSFQASLYQTFIDDAIIRVPSADGLITTNGGDGDIFGYEARAAWRFAPNWEAEAHIARQDGRQESNGQTDAIRRLHPLQGAASITWTHPDEHLWIRARVNAAERQNNLSRLAASDTQRIPVNGTPGYIIPSLAVGWQPREDLELTLVLDNLTDEDYRIHGSGQNAQGINATLGLKYSW